MSIRARQTGRGRSDGAQTLREGIGRGWWSRWRWWRRSKLELRQRHGAEGITSAQPSKAATKSTATAESSRDSQGTPIGLPNIGNVTFRLPKGPGRAVSQRCWWFPDAGRKADDDQDAAARSATGSGPVAGR